MSVVVWVPPDTLVLDPLERSMLLRDTMSFLQGTSVPEPVHISAEFLMLTDPELEFFETLPELETLLRLVRLLL